MKWVNKIDFRFLAGNPFGNPLRLFVIWNYFGSSAIECIDFEWICLRVWSYLEFFVLNLSISKTLWLAFVRFNIMIFTKISSKFLLSCRLNQNEILAISQKCRKISVKKTSKTHGGVIKDPFPQNSLYRFLLNIG